MKKIFALLIILAFCFSSLALAQYKFFDGNDWANLNNKQIPELAKRKMKIMLLQAVHEASTYIGNPVLEPTEKNLAKYLVLTNETYENEATRALPLMFALKTAEMQYKKMPPRQVQAYKMIVLQKLENQGIITVK